MIERPSGVASSAIAIETLKAREETAPRGAPPPAPEEISTGHSQVGEQ